MCVPFLYVGNLRIDHFGCVAVITRITGKMKLMCKINHMNKEIRSKDGKIKGIPPSPTFTTPLPFLRWPRKASEAVGAKWAQRAAVQNWNRTAYPSVLPQHFSSPPAECPNVQESVGPLVAPTPLRPWPQMTLQVSSGPWQAALECSAQVGW